MKKSNIFKKLVVFVLFTTYKSLKYTCYIGFNDYLNKYECKKFNNVGHYSLTFRRSI